MQNFKNKFLLTTALIATLAFGGQVHAMEAGDEIAQARAQFQTALRRQQVTGPDLVVAEQIAGRLFSQEAVRSLSRDDLQNYVAQLIENCVRQGPARTEELQMLQLMVETAFPGARVVDAPAPEVREGHEDLLRRFTAGRPVDDFTNEIVADILGKAREIGALPYTIQRLDYANRKGDMHRMDDLFEVQLELTREVEILARSRAPAVESAAPVEEAVAVERAAPVERAAAAYVPEGVEVVGFGGDADGSDREEEAVVAPASVVAAVVASTEADVVERAAPLPASAPLTAEEVQARAKVVQARIDEIVGRDALAQAAGEMRRLMTLRLAAEATDAERTEHQRATAAARSNLLEAQRAFQARVASRAIPSEAHIVARLLASGVSQAALDALRGELMFWQPDAE